MKKPKFTITRITLDGKDEDKKMKKSMIKLNPLWEEKKLTKKDKENYKKATGLTPKKLYMLKDDVWEKLMNLMIEEKK